MRCSWIAAAIVLACAGAAAAQGTTYNLGRAPTEEELNPAGAAIGPDGQGLPDGSGTAAEGALLYVARGCSQCHGPTGVEGPGPHLVGERGSGNPEYDAFYEGGNWQGRGIRNFMFATQIWSWINQGMPLNLQGFLTADEVYAPDGVPAAPQRHHRGGRRPRRREPAAGADAEPGRLRVHTRSSCLRGVEARHAPDARQVAPLPDLPPAPKRCRTAASAPSTAAVGASLPPGESAPRRSSPAPRSDSPRRTPRLRPGTACPRRRRPRSGAAR